jgi:plasmid stabilization system protein ParE
MEVRWSLPSAEDLEHICEGIERENPAAARRVARTIYEERARLKDFPNLGRTSRRMAGRRELTFAPLPYIVVHQVKPEAIEISRIFHGAQDWP